LWEELAKQPFACDRLWPLRVERHVGPPDALRAELRSMKREVADAILYTSEA